MPIQNRKRKVISHFSETDGYRKRAVHVEPCRTRDTAPSESPAVGKILNKTVTTS